jgi:hypothetical protein
MMREHEDAQKRQPSEQACGGISHTGSILMEHEVSGFLSTDSPLVEWPILTSGRSRRAASIRL